MVDRERTAWRAAGGRDCWFALARRLGAGYAVLDPELRGALGPTPSDFERVWARDGYSVWRRRGAA